ncbi:MAG: MFS transporter [Desulfocapsaceae bacterium]
MRSVSANIYYLYLIKLSKWLMLIMPVVVLFYNENGLETFQIYLLQAGYSISVVLFEIPSGYLADIIGRRYSLIWGSVLGTAGFALLSVSHSFNGFLVAEMILGVGGSLISGADSALLYDSLAATSRQHYYLRYEGRITALGNLGETCAAIFGGILAAWLGYRSVYFAQTVIAAIGVPAALLLIEPARKKLVARPSIGEIYRISKEALFINKQLSGVIFSGAVAGTATLCMAWTAQIYFVDNGFSEKEITPLWVLLNLTVALVSAASATVVTRIGIRRAVLISALLPVGFVLIGLLPLVPALSVLFFFYLIRGYTTPLFRDLINRNCDSAVRATVLSIRSLLIRLFFSIGGPLIGYLAGRSSLQHALVVFGILLAVGSLAASTFMFRHQRFTDETFKDDLVS